VIAQRFTLASLRFRNTEVCQFESQATMKWWKSSQFEITRQQFDIFGKCIYTCNCVVVSRCYIFLFYGLIVANSFEVYI
jgi:hypothetical protein